MRSCARGLSGQDTSARREIGAIYSAHPESIPLRLACVSAAGLVPNSRPLMDRMARDLRENHTLTREQEKALDGFLLLGGDGSS
jgi:hypothetical protein